MKKRILPLLSLGLPVLGLTACSSELKATLADAGQNTLIGMGVVFVVLILISLVISLFKLINSAQDKAAKKKEAKTKNGTPVSELTEEPAPAAEAEPEEELSDDLELVAVIAAAIAASENTDPSGIIVRSIRRVSSANNWKRG